MFNFGEVYIVYCVSMKRAIAIVMPKWKSDWQMYLRAAHNSKWTSKSFLPEMSVAFSRLIKPCYQWQYLRNHCPICNSFTTISCAVISIFERRRCSQRNSNANTDAMLSFLRNHVSFIQISRLAHRTQFCFHGATSACVCVCVCACCGSTPQMQIFQSNKICLDNRWRKWKSIIKSKCLK